MTELASLVIKFGADISDIKTGVNSIHSELSRLESAVGRTSGALGGFAGSLGRIAETAAGFVAANVAMRGLETTFGAVSNAVVGFNAKLSNAQIGFETMLGSAEKANTLLRELQQFAATTPFQFPELVQASQRLIAFGFSVRDVIPTLTAIGDAAAASGSVSQESIGRITTALGQMAARGKASSQEMLQLTEAGIPSWAILSQAIGKTTAETMKMVEDGLIPADVALKALIEGMENRAPGAMARMQHTWTGAVSNIKDSFEQLTAGGLKPVFDGLTVMADRLAQFLATPAVDQFASRVSAALTAVSKGFDAAFHGRGAEATAEFAKAGEIFQNLGQQIQYGFLRILQAIEPAVQPIVATLSELATNAAVWGFNLMAEFGAGMVQGAATVIVSAMTAIGGMIAEFIASFSPPKRGVLRNINIWGANLINEYFKGFMNADFTIFDSLTKTIQDLLKIQVQSGSLGELDEIPRLIELQELMGRAITQTREFGQVSDDVWERAGELLGEATEDVRGLFDALMQLSQVNTQIDGINNQLRDYQRQLGEVDAAWRELERPIEANIRAAERAYSENVRGLEAEIRAIDRKIELLRNIPRPDTSALDMEIALTREVSDRERLREAENAHLERAARLTEQIEDINERINRGVADRARDLSRLNEDTDRTVSRTTSDASRNISRENSEAERRKNEIQRELQRNLATETDPRRAAQMRERAAEQMAEIERRRIERVGDMQREADERVADARRNQVERTAEIERRALEQNNDLVRRRGELEAQREKEGQQTGNDRLQVLQAQRQLVEDTVGIEAANRAPQLAALQAQKDELQAQRDLYAEQKDDIERQKQLLADIKQGHADEAQTIRDSMEPLQMQRDMLELQRDDLTKITSNVQSRISHEREVAGLLERQAQALERAASAGGAGGAGGGGRGGAGAGLGGNVNLAGVAAGVRVPRREMTDREKQDALNSLGDTDPSIDPAAALEAEAEKLRLKIEKLMQPLKEQIKKDIKEGFREGFDRALDGVSLEAKLTTATAGVGAIIGFAVGGPMGAAIGAAAGGAIARMGIGSAKFFQSWQLDVINSDLWSDPSQWGKLGGRIWGGIKSGLEQATRASEWTLDLVGRLSERLLNSIEKVGGDIVRGITKGAKTAWDEAGDWLSEHIERGVNAVKRFLRISSPSEYMADEVGKPFVSGFFKGAQTAWDDAVSWLENTGQRAIDNIGELSETLYDNGRRLVTGLWNGAKSLWNDDIKPWLTKTGSRSLDEIGDLIDSVVSRGEELFKGFKNGAITLWNNHIKPWLAKTGARALDEIGGLTDSVASRGHELLSGLKNGAANFWNEHIKPWLGDTGSRALDSIGDLTGSVVSRGTELLTGLLKGLKDLWGAVGGGTETVAGWLGDLANKALAAVPDLSRTLVNAGRSLVSGIRTGIEEAWSAFTSWFDRLLGGLSGRASSAASQAMQPKVADRRAPTRDDFYEPNDGVRPPGLGYSVGPDGLPVNDTMPQVPPPGYSVGPDGLPVNDTMPTVSPPTEAAPTTGAADTGGSGTTPINLTPAKFQGMSADGPYLKTDFDYNMPMLTAWTEGTIERVTKAVDTAINRAHFAFLNMFGDIDWGGTWDPAKLAEQGQARERAWNEFLKQEMAQGKTMANLAEMMAEFNQKFGTFGSIGGSPATWDFTNTQSTSGSWLSGVQGAVGGANGIVVNIDASGSTFATRGQMDEYTDMLVKKIDRRLGEITRTRTALGGR